MMKIGEKIFFVKSCFSTNDLARDLASKGASEGTVVISEEQTKGRGRMGRKWFSPQKKGIYLSVILRPPKPEISLIPLLAGLSLSDALREAEGIRVQLKWPNDLVWKGKKLGGILCESSFLGNRLSYVILGIGLNVSHKKEDFPEEFRFSAASLWLITKKMTEEKVLLEKLWSALNHWYSLFLQHGEEEVVNTFREYSLFKLGEKLVVKTEEASIEGTYRGIDLSGGLLFESQGEELSFLSAQVDAITRIKEG